MNLDKIAEQLQVLFEETNKAVKGNWTAPEIGEIVKILRDNLNDDAWDDGWNKRDLARHLEAQPKQPSKASPLGEHGEQQQECSYCGGEGWLENDQPDKPMCQKCKGTGRILKSSEQIVNSICCSLNYTLTEDEETFVREQINAALAAEADKVLRCSQENVSLQCELGEAGLELASERQRTQQAEQALVTSQLEILTERQRRERADKIRRETQIQFNKLEARLLSALAVIEKAKARVCNCPLHETVFENVDLSALREHDEKLTVEVEKRRDQWWDTEVVRPLRMKLAKALKARKPLVDALEWISSECGREAGLRADAALKEIKDIK